MNRKVERVQFKLPPKPQLTKVAAYARVSSGKDTMLHSLSAQVSYYSEYIQSHPGWLYCGVYADEAFTGTKEDRVGFQEMLSECRAGKIDMVITKSISRFARNTVTLLATVRELRELGIDVYFEEQNIHTMSADGELMMTILASYAQEESRSNSENQKWRIKANFEEGKPWTGRMLGYRYKDGQLEVIPEEAEIVRRIFADYLSGMGYLLICRGLNGDGLTTLDGYPWRVGTLMKVLRNYDYTGNLLLQKTYRENHITKKRLLNRGEHPMYHALETHEPVIPLETFNAVQAEMARRAEKYGQGSDTNSFLPFSHKITCACCGGYFNRKTARGKKIWICRTYNTVGKSGCSGSKAVPEEALLSAAAEVLGLEEFDEAVFSETVEGITAEGNTLIFRFADGLEQTAVWADRSRSESWTPEMKEKARQQTAERRRNERREK